MQKRSVSLAGHRTSVSLETEFWRALEREASRIGVSLPMLIGEIDRARLGQMQAGRIEPGQTDGAPPNLASALRVFVLRRLEARLSAVGDEAEGGITENELGVKP